MAAKRCLPIVLAAIFTLAGCASLSHRDSRKDLIGIWYGNARSVDTGEHGDNLLIRTADGRYVGYFRVCDHGEQRNMIETGRWSVDGDIETTITETVDGISVDADEYYRETYKINALSRDAMVYSSIKLGHDFTSTRVTGSTRIPDNICD